MATGGGNSEECPLCLDPFTRPKFLPCFHTFCQHCIEDLLRGKPDTPFPCPSCRKTTTLPPGGAAGLQTNFYISSASSPGTVATPAQVTTPASTLTQDVCDTHPGKELERYCKACDKPICISCKLTDHETHRTVDITAVVVAKRQELQSDRQRLQKAVSGIKTQVKTLNEDKDSLDSHVAAVEKTIRKRHATVVETSRKQMEEQLHRLRSERTELSKEIVKDIEERETNTAMLATLLRQVDNVVSSGTAKDVLTAVEEMRSGRGSQTAVESMTSREERPTLRPDLHSTVSDDDMTQTTRDYLGTVRLLEMKVTERFRCSEDPDTEVFSLCHEDCDPPRVLVSYDKLGRNENASVQVFSESGQCVFTGGGDKVGRISYKWHSKGRCMYERPKPGKFVTYCKHPAAPHLQLHNKLNGEGVIYRATITSTDPLKTEFETEFTINVNRHRAFDVDTSQNYFAVVEEAGTGSSSNQVHLYDRSQKTPVSTYHPPVQDSQPTDVLFHHIGGQPVLLVADGLSSALHVLSFQGGQLEFHRYLCEGCPLLQKPSALTVDLHGRVWLGCKGGRIVTVEEFQ